MFGAITAPAPSGTFKPCVGYLLAHTNLSRAHLRKPSCANARLSFSIWHARPSVNPGPKPPNNSRHTNAHRAWPKPPRSNSSSSESTAAQTPRPPLVLQPLPTRGVRSASLCRAWTSCHRATTPSLQTWCSASTWKSSTGVCDCVIMLYICVCMCVCV